MLDKAFFDSILTEVLQGTWFKAGSAKGDLLYQRVSWLRPENLRKILTHFLETASRAPVVNSVVAYAKKVQPYEPREDKPSEDPPCGLCGTSGEVLAFCMVQDECNWPDTRYPCKCSRGQKRMQNVKYCHDRDLEEWLKRKADFFERMVPIRLPIETDNPKSIRQWVEAEMEARLGHPIGGHVVRYVPEIEREAKAHVEATKRALAERMEQSSATVAVSIDADNDEIPF